MYYTNIIKSISARGLFTLLALIMSISLHAQNATVKGVIVDETDTPLIGATVQVKGTATGSITDFDGNYTIKANKGAVITFSYIGYKTQEIKFTGQSPLNVKMIPDNQTLDEVVVVGYGTMKRSDLTGSVASIAAKDVEGFKTSSVAGALGGQIAGVQITSTDGTPGAGFSINIRGVGTLTGDSSPLYIVDGFEVDDIDYLSNSDIESIEVLKDASSSAIYGARAANGVVLITTKSGKTGRPTITTTKDYIVNYQDLQGIGITTRLALPTLIALASIALNKPTVSSLAVMGEISIAGTMMKVDELANALQVCLDSGAKKVLLPIASAADLGLVPSDLIGCFNLIFYQSAEDAVFKALGVE